MFEELKNTPKYSVYVGRQSGKIVYVGTTTQRPGDRFRHHFANGKKFDFEVMKQCDDEKQMLDEEYKLIQKYNPKYNKIKHRKQNLNKKLSQDQLDLRKGDSEWCQCCLKRRVNKGYKFCLWCS